MKSALAPINQQWSDKMSTIMHPLTVELDWVTSVWVVTNKTVRFNHRDVLFLIRRKVFEPQPSGWSIQNSVAMSSDSNNLFLFWIATDIFDRRHHSKRIRSMVDQTLESL